MAVLNAWKSENAEGSIVMESPVPGVVLSTFAGSAQEAFTGPPMALLDSWVAQGMRVAIFVDASNLKSYETGYRRAWTSWLLANRAHVAGVHMLVTSRFIEMGLTVVNLATNNMITGYARADAFKQALDRAVLVARQAGTGRAPTKV